MASLSFGEKEQDHYTVPLSPASINISANMIQYRKVLLSINNNKRVVRGSADQAQACKQLETMRFRGESRL